jgi:hypothetical protein
MFGLSESKLPTAGPAVRRPVPVAYCRGCRIREPWVVPGMEGGRMRAMQLARHRAWAVAVLLLAAMMAVASPAAPAAAVPARARPVSPASSRLAGGLAGVAAASARRAWAAGGTLILRWNGTRWKQVPSPGSANIIELRSVAVTSARNAWAVGNDYKSRRVLIMRWNGATWK